MPTVQSVNFIEYGRRLGKQKQPSKLPPGLEKIPSVFPDDVKETNGSTSKNERILSVEEWNRVQHNLYARKYERERIKQAKIEKDQLHEESKTNVKHWPNTLEGDRQLKLISRKLRDDADEEHKQKIDIEEKKIQAKNRKEAIEKAKSDQYFDSDRMKALRGALLLTEVLMEREKQIEIKNNPSNYKYERERKLMEQNANEHKRGMLEEELKKKEKFDKCKAVKNFELMQIEEKKVLEKQEKIDDLLEKQRLQKYGQFCEWESDKLDLIREAEKGTVKKMLLEQMDNRVAIQELENQLEEEENNEIRAFAKAKRKIARMRKDRENELQQQLIDQRLKMANQLSETYQQQLEEDASAMNKAIAEKDAAKKEEEERLANFRKEQMKETNIYRKQQVTHKELIEEEEKLKDLAHFKTRIEADTLFLEKRQEYMKKRKVDRRKLHDYHLAQINERAEGERKEREQDFKSDKCLEDILEKEERQLANYADEVIARLKPRGYNDYPLRKVIASGIGGGREPRQDRKGGVRPSFQCGDESGTELPCFKRGSTDIIRCKNRTEDVKISKKRLGFIW